MLEHDLVVENPLQDLFVSGCCADLTIRTWQAKTNAKSFFDELGIKDTPWSDNFLTGGQMKFITDDVRKSFHQHEVRARVWLDQNSYSFMNVRFVPFTAIDTLLYGDGERPGLNQMKKEFESAVNEFLNKFDDIRSEYINKMSDMNEKYRGVLEKTYPSKDIVQNKFEFDWVFYESKVPQIFDDSQERIMRKCLDDKASLFIKESPEILKNKITCALEKFDKVLKSKSTVKSSSLSAIRKAIHNFDILNFTDNEFINELGKINQAINGIINIDSEDAYTRGKISTIVSQVLENAHK